jgi:hypothetical protein
MDLEQEKTINSIVQEYLRSSSYPLTCQSLETESEAKGLVLSSSSADRKADEARTSNLTVKLSFQRHFKSFPIRSIFFFKKK